MPSGGKTGVPKSLSPLFFRVFFMIQAIINFVVGSASYTAIKHNRFAINGTGQYFVYIGLCLAFIGLFFEVVGDEQLRVHIKKKEAIHFCNPVCGQSHVIQITLEKY